MSFKYRLILFYIIIEVFFISLIVGVNFSALKNASIELTNEKIDSNISFLEELVKIPISVYDLGILDDLVNKSVSLTHIDSLVILDSDNNILSEKYNNKNLSKETILNVKDKKVFDLYDKYLTVIHKTIYEEDIFIGTIYVVFDNTSSDEFIKENSRRTIIIILIEIFISIFISHYLGTKLTNMLSVLSDKAEEIGEDKNPKIPYLDQKDEVGILAKSLDKMKNDLITRNNNIKEIQNQKDSFFANMSHELKTPLNSINIISSVMLKNKSNTLESNDLKNIEIINKCGKDLLLLINDILDITKLEAGEIRANNEKFSIKLLFDDIVNMFNLSAKEKGIEFKYKIDENLKFINNDEVRIKQIIINLVGNAIKFTDNGYVEFIINDLNDDLQIIVKDSGIGISKEKQETIFERFKQVDDGISRKYGGTGLGLSICKELAQVLGGNIIVISEKGVGSEFIVTIKKDFSNLIENSSKDSTETSINTDNQIIKNELVKKDIIVLNSDVIGFMPLSVELKRKSNKFILVSEFEQFTKHIINEKFDVIVLNIQNHSQFILYDTLSGVEFDKLFLISNNDLIDDNLKDLACDIFIKPINKDEFIQKVTV